MTREFVPHDYQEDIIDFICQLRRCAVWASMGAGKTVATLTALERLNMVEDVYPVLILAPLRVARTTWPTEVKRWRHLEHLNVVPITGTQKQRERAAARDGEVYTSNYDNLVWLREWYGDKWPFRTVVADEFTRLKSFRIRQGGSRARALGQVAHTHVTRFIGLTGTPAPNGIRDLWGPSWFLDQGERLGKTFSAFEQRWFKKGYDGYSLVAYDHTQEEVQEKLKDICLTIDAVASMGVDDAVVRPLFVDLPIPARRVYAEMERELFAELASGEVIEAANAMVKTQKCLQLANGTMYVDDDHNWEAVHAAKLEALDSIIEEASGAPVLVAYHFRHDLERIKQRFKHAKVLDADPQTIREWNAGKISILLAHPASAGHGLNLADGGNILAFYGVNWNLEEYLQIIERIGPMRQKQAGYDRPCLVYPILARDTIDEVVMERLASKRTIQDVLLDAMKRKK